MPALAVMFAEVSDKEPTLAQLWGLALFFSVLGYFACRWRWWTVLLVLPVPTIWALGFSEELRDPFVRPAIVSELGDDYVIQAYMAMFLPFLCVVFAVWKAVMQRKRRSLHGSHD